ncbi:DUF2842 domain-containing protein [Neogemmobacter tilapiae]|jgi:hypothetical protein|uniref:DUF2842 domain-containing protein n=1 Tax=Neogemmobacter tilapiae TaxID=875041 RepID=A0A918WNA3_9RHOB|nr:DUF2842 domain-containing protein [Gemmobacter tilapiae]GHC62187.1 hypothetical protein GCM10007315_27780 [Gemmobacter tilapiae]
MALSYKAKKRLSLLILLVGLPVYIGLAWFLVSLFERPNMVIELGIYIGLGIVWAVPFKAVFRGIGQPDPNEKAEGE